jgi:hypothetical protein
MNPKILSILTFILISFSLQGQELSVGYLGNNLWNPGLNLSVDKKINNLNHTIDLAVFNDPGSHTAAFVLYGLQKVKPKWSFSAYPIGLYRSFLPNTYKIDASGQISEPSNIAGNFYFSPAISVKRRHIKRFYTKAQVLILMPYNTFIMPVFNVGIGYVFHKEKQEKTYIQL